MARKPRPDWDVSADAPDYRTPRNPRDVPSYAPSTNTTQRGASRRMAQAVAKKQNSRSFVNGRVFENGKLIGTAPTEDSRISRVKPRSLRVRGQS